MPFRTHDIGLSIIFTIFTFVFIKTILRKSKLVYSRFYYWVFLSRKFHSLLNAGKRLFIYYISNGEIALTYSKLKPNNCIFGAIGVTLHRYYLQ